MARQGKGLVVLYLGDHDPSGIDMTRDVDERLRTFARTRQVDVRRLALNMDQVEEHRPPENPAKTTDSRSADYIRKFGESSWELDALEPALLASLVRNEILSLRDPEEWAKAEHKEGAMKKRLHTYAEQERKRKS